MFSGGWKKVKKDLGMTELLPIPPFCQRKLTTQRNLW
jgi:hypothetical protein